ncbi:ABC transporter ATP-binding protein [Roseofilum reptotaenium CS-1145]|uniref:ABC transporter ATP-binding protein n=1 Tax=Roseofilum reptotaenium AO1-A TaxID=1925591 RepID=A0A1L9QWL7_9CYAN|nr:ABC transporter ATP-binding protein [Roseofilum reptotaenium]MDB9518575.1 ABC transporter ATP-binding protein [Roseofilum reptotaenium CS-1145]OJJ27026.1 ABC transporter ATP-binding protein [Roseofilum reptotaenium AO1-A]
MQSQLQLLKNLKRAIALVWQSTPFWATLTIILVFLQGLLPLASLYLMKLLIDTVTAGIGKGMAAFYDVLAIVILVGITALITNLLRALSGYATQAQSQIVTDSVNDILHSKSVELDLEYYENANFYNSLHRAQQEASYRPQNLLNSLLQLAQNAISLVAIAALLLSLHWSISLVLLAAALPVLLVRLQQSKILYRQQKTWTGKERMAWYFHWMLTLNSYAKEIRLFDLGSLFRRRYYNLRQEIRQEKLALARQRAIADFLTQLSGILAIFAVFSFIAYQTIQGEITLGSLVMYYQGFQRGQAFLGQLLSNIASLYENSLFLSHLYEFLDLKPTIANPIHPQWLPQPFQKGLRFENVSFQYPHSRRPLLEDINLTIPAGETVALVGENGAGKTTLIKLLCRLYDPTNGRITIDGVDLRELSVIDWRRNISVVFQDYVRYNLTVRENIGFGNIDHIDNHPDIIKAAQKSGAEGIISRLPRGYDTMLGTQFEEGEELSIGEWQKVAIARAFLRPAQLLILDEPTSALDAEAEYEVFEQFRQLIQGKTAILISHRLSTVKMVDRIFVLENGSIVETGSHEELLGVGGTYARLFAIQAKYYQ